LSAKRHSNKHHLLPTSRGGPKEWWNLRNKEIKKHRCFHIIFVNLLPCEIVEKIKQWTATKSKRLDRRKLTKKKGQRYIKIKCWEILFGRNSRREKIIALIKKDWAVKDQKNFKGCFGYKECFMSRSKRKCPLIEKYKRGGIK